jgi:hypothetical protein
MLDKQETFNHRNVEWLLTHNNMKDQVTFFVEILGFATSDNSNGFSSLCMSHDILL